MQGKMEEDQAAGGRRGSSRGHQGVRTYTGACVRLVWSGLGHFCPLPSSSFAFALLCFAFWGKKKRKEKKRKLFFTIPGHRGL